MDDVQYLIMYQLNFGFRGVCIGFIRIWLSYSKYFKIISLPNDIYAMEVLPMFLSPEDIIIVYF